MWRKFSRWILVLLLGAGVIAGAGAWYVWVQGDHYAREAVYRKLSEIAPASRIEMGRVQFDWKSEVAIKDLRIGTKSPDDPRLLIVPEMTVEIDSQAFLNDQTVRIERLCLIRPRLEVTRNLDGTWTTSQLLPLHVDPNMQVPAWDIQDATILLRLAQPNADPIELTLEHADFMFKPIGRRQLAIEGRSRVADAGPVAVTGEIDLDKLSWSITGGIQRLNTSGSIAGFVWNASAAFRERLQTLEDRLAGAQTARTDANASPGDLPPGADDVQPLDGHSAWAGVLARLGIEATLDVDFALASAGKDKPLDYEIDLTCQDGQITNPILPFPLSQLQAKLHWNRQTFRLAGLSAQNNSTLLECHGEYHHGAKTPKGAFEFAVQNLVFGKADYDDLPPSVAKILDIIEPRGIIDLTGKIERAEGGTWAPRDIVATAKDVRVTADPFPYPITGIQGTLHQSTPDLWVVNLQGLAGTRAIKCQGHFTGPAAGAEMELKLTGQPIPIDQNLRNACRAEARQALEMLDISGTADLEVTIARAAGKGMPVTWGFLANVSNGGMCFSGFPYRLTQMKGIVEYDSVSELLQFRDVTARHDRATISGSGSFRKPMQGKLTVGPSGEIGGLDMALSGRNVLLDEDLREALPANLKLSWDDLRPGGRADFDSRIIWIPDYQPDIEFSQIALTEGRLSARAFPYALESIVARARFTPWRATALDSEETEDAELIIDEFVGWHGGMRVTANNSRMTLGLDGRWQLDLLNLNAEDFSFDADLHRAVPQAIRRPLERFNPQGKFNVTGKLTCRGDKSPATSPDLNWDLALVTQPEAQAAISLATDVTNIAGRVHTKGWRTEKALSIDGNLNLERATVLGQSMTNIRGPFQVRDNLLTVGSAKALPSREQPQSADVPTEEQLRGELLDGLLTFNTRATLGEVPEFHAVASLAGGSLEKYVAASVGGGPGQLAGVMTGHVNFWGTGFTADRIQGRGQLDIVPASLYRLPAIMQIFQAFSFAPPNGPAFSSARLIFTIRNSAFHFQPNEGGSIVLSGDTLRLVGGGRVDFDRVLDLHFYTASPRNPAGPLQGVPLLNEVVGGLVQAATNGFAKVQVTGRADNPRVDIIPLPFIPEIWQNIMNSPVPRGAGRAIGFP